MVASGTLARITCDDARASIDAIRPRRDARSPVDGAHVLLGRHHLDLHDRLEQHGLAFFSASLNAIDAAILNAISDESTS
jgi:hypothetical protein